MYYVKRPNVVKAGARRHATKRLAGCVDAPPNQRGPMFLSDIIQLAVVYAFGVWAQYDMAQCVAGFDWVRASFDRGCGY